MLEPEYFFENARADGRASLHVENARADGQASLHVENARADGRVSLHVEIYVYENLTKN